MSTNKRKKLFKWTEIFKTTNEELINILNTLGFEWYGFEDSIDGSGYFLKVKDNKRERYSIYLYYFTSLMYTWKVGVCNGKKGNLGALYFKGNEVSLEDINSLIRICKINLILE